MVQARSWNWVGVFAFICGAAVIIPSLVALVLSLAAVARNLL
jgi:hypothetical protein